MSKHKNKTVKAQNKTVKDNSINADSIIKDSVFMGDGFGQPKKSGSSNVKVSGEFDLLPIVIREYANLHNKPSLYTKKRDTEGKIMYGDDKKAIAICENPNQYNMADFIDYMIDHNYVVLPNGVLCFNALFLALRHGYKLNPDTYSRGGGLQCYITAIGSPKNKNGVSHGLVRLVQEIGFSCMDKQYTGRYRKSFLGRMWIIRKPQPAQK